MKTKSKQCLISFTVLFILLCSLLPLFARGEYTNDAISIDGSRDDAYEKSFQGINFTVYYSNSEDFHYVYITFLNDISNSSLFLRDGALTYNLTEDVLRSDLRSVRGTTSLELKVLRDTVSNSFSITTKNLQINMECNPEGVPEESEQEKDKGDDEKSTGSFTPVDLIVDAFIYLNDHPYLYLLLSLFLCIATIRFWRVALSPYCWFKGENGKIELVGRFVSDEKIDYLPGYRKYTFKHNGITQFYCKRTFHEIREHPNLNVGPFKYFTDVVIKNLDVSGEDFKIYEKERVKTRKNTLRYIVYKLINILLPSTRIGYSAYQRVEFKIKRDENGKKVRKKSVKILQHQLLMPRILAKEQVTYEKKEYNIKEGKQPEWVQIPKPVWVTVPEKADLEADDDIRDLDSLDYKFVEKQPDSLEEAIQKQQHFDNYKGLADLKLSKITREYLEKDKQYNKVRGILQRIKRNIESMVMDQVLEIEQKADMSGLNIKEFTAKLLGEKKKGFKMEKVVQEAYKQLSPDQQQQGIPPQMIPLMMKQYFDQIAHQNQQKERGSGLEKPVINVGSDHGKKRRRF